MTIVEVRDSVMTQQILFQLHCDVRRGVNDKMTERKSGEVAFFLIALTSRAREDGRFDSAGCCNDVRNRFQGESSGFAANSQRGM